MAKIIKKRKQRNLTLMGLSTFLMISSLAAFFFTAIFVRTYNNSMIRSIEDKTDEIARIQNENEYLDKHIAELSNITRVSQVAQDAGLKNSKNTMVIAPGE